MIDGDSRKRGLAGVKGWPKSFAQPELFLDRLAPALKWKDLTGTKREDKPWLDGLPRIIFLNDMGDTFSKKLPLNWLAPLLPLMADSPHQFLMLTKRPSAAAEFSERFPFPANFWLGTSITSNAVKGRAEQLRRCQGGSRRFLSIEPIWEDIDATVYAGMDWVIFGGESGPEANETQMEHIVTGNARAQIAGCKVFVKQIGANPVFLQTGCDPTGNHDIAVNVPFKIRDSHGGDMAEWPNSLRVRQMPAPFLRPAKQGALL